MSHTISEGINVLFNWVLLTAGLFVVYKGIAMASRAIDHRYPNKFDLYEDARKERLRKLNIRGDVE